MAWSNITSGIPIGYGGNVFADVYLQYDDSDSGNVVDTRVYVYIRPGSLLSVYFDDVTVDDTNYGRHLIDANNTTISTGSHYRSTHHTINFTATWGSGPTSYNGSGYTPYMTLSGLVRGTNSFTGTITAEYFPSGSEQWIELVVSNQAYQTGGIPQLYTKVSGTWSSTITVNNSSTPASGGITINPNTSYYIGSTGYNGDFDEFVRYNHGQHTTLAAAATVSVASTTTDSVTINYSTSADGGKYSKSIQYSIDGGTTWVTGATVATGSASTGTYTISNLAASTTYTIQTRVTTSAGSSTGSTLTATTTGAQATLYGSVSGNTKEITELYGPAEIPTYEITALTNNIGFDADAFISKWVEEQGYMTDTPERLDIRNDDFDGHHLRVSFTHSAAVYFASWTGTYDGSLSDWGFGGTPVAGVFSSIITPALATKKITKLYGSVNGQTKLIYEAQ